MNYNALNSGNLSLSNERIKQDNFTSLVKLYLSVGNIFNVYDYKGATNYMGVKEKNIYNNTAYKFNCGVYISYVFKNGDYGTKNIKG